MRPCSIQRACLEWGKNSATLPNLHIAGRQEKYTYFYTNTVAETVATVCGDLVSPYSLAIQGTAGREELLMSTHWPSCEMKCSTQCKQFGEELEGI